MKPTKTVTLVTAFRACTVTSGNRITTGPYAGGVEIVFHDICSTVLRLSSLQRCFLMTEGFIIIDDRYTVRLT